MELDLKIFFLCLVFFTMFFCLGAFSQNEIQKTKDTTYILGKVNWAQWTKLANWPDYQAEDYNPDSLKTVYLEKIIKTENINFILFSATWCSDSKDQVPKIIKLLKSINFNIDKLEIYGVDRSKKEPSHIAEMMMIEFIPTLIILRDGLETGRIMEFPRPGKTWEDEIIGILLSNHQK
jgi:thiol-disulfide isomerase/thioredoxin